jgi:hypothetical protein
MSAGHYQARPLRLVNRSANTAWTQSPDARLQRAIAVWCMPRLRERYASTNPEEQRSAHMAIVRLLKGLGLLSPDPYWADVSVNRIIADGEAWQAELNQTDAVLDEIEREIR